MFHIKIIKHLDDRLLAVAAPREFAKSTVINTVTTLYELFFNKFRYQIFIGDTATNAQDNLAAVVKEIETNQLLINDFGLLKPAIPVKWTDGAIITENNIKIEALGVGSKIRGRKHLQWRPDRLIFDDIENDENVSTKEQRIKLFRWFFSAALNARAKRGSKVRIIGTILHFDSLLANLMDKNKYQSWTKMLFRAVNYQKDGVPYSLWPDYWTLEDLAAKKKEIGTVLFNQEYQNLPVSEETAIIKKSWIKYYDFDKILAQDVNSLLKIMRVDPAIKEKEENDKFALVILGINSNGQIYELDNFTEKINFHKQVNTIFNYAEKWKLKPKDEIHIENNAYQHALKQEIERISKEKGLYYTVKGKTTITDKTMRLKGVSGMVENGYILFRNRGNDELIEQMTMFGKTKYDDLVDALVGALEGIQTITPAYLSYVKAESEKAKKQPEKSFINEFKNKLQVYG